MYHAVTTKGAKVRRALLYVVMIVLSLTMLVPFVWMISASLKYEGDVFTFPIQWIPENIRWENYADVFERIPFATYYRNSLIVAGSITLLQVITCSMSAYSLSKIDYPERNKIFLTYLCTLMVPYQVIMIPQFLVIKNLHLVDTLASVILIAAFSAFGVFLFRQFFLSIPDSISDAARVDGCSEFQIYARIIMPLSKPAIASLVIFTFVSAWNDFLGPLIYLNSDSVKTIQLGIQSFASIYNTEYALIMAAATMAIVPIIIIFLLCQDKFIEGIASTGVKG